MAKRPVFIVNKKDKKFVEIVDTEFKWYPGLSKTQKQKSIDSLHAEFKKDNPNYNVLEISSKSENSLGVKLSAFNLNIKLKNGSFICLESAFQGSKVFEDGGPYQDLYWVEPKLAKKDERIKNSGKLVHFKFFNQVWEIEPKTLFYDWLYINSLYMESKLAKEIINYDAFTDIEFNPQKSINCQAYSAALFVSLSKLDILNKSIQCVDNYKNIIKKGITKKKTEKQKSIFDFID